MRSLSIAAVALAIHIGFVCFPVYADTGVPPVITTSWAPNHVAPGGITQVRFDIGNPGTTAALTGVAFDDVLPAGLTVGNIGATPIGCGIVSAVAPSTIHFTMGTIAANTPSISSPCNFEINITTAVEGVLTNTTTTVTSIEGGTGIASSAVLTVGNPPTLSTSFGAAIVGSGQSVSLSLSVVNPNATVAVSGLGFINSLPSGLVVATPNGASNTCGGTLTATAGSSSILLTGGALVPAGSCSVAVNIAAATAGAKNDSVQITTTNLGNGNTSTASLTVLSPPTITKAFGSAMVKLNGTTSLSFMVSNPNGASELSGITLSDNLPSGLVVATPSGQMGTCLATAGQVTAAGTLTATAGSGSISISGLRLASSGSCSYTLNVIGTTAGTKVNTTGNISSTNGGTGGTATASLTVNLPPVAVPTLSQWGMMILALGLMFISWRTIAKRRKV